MKFFVFPTLLFFIYFSTLALSLNYGEASVKAKKINKKAVLNREVSNGDLIDCVYEKEQQAFCNSLLRDHKIQEKPKQSLRIKKDELTNKINKTSQIWSKNESPYPEDHTDHVRQKTSTNTLQTNSISNFKSKRHPFYRQLTENDTDEFATAIYEEPAGVYGVRALINYWNPRIAMGATNKEYSGSFIRIRSGSDVLEAGWHVFPWFYTEEGDTVEDDKTRFYIFWTNDSRNGLTCYNEEYPGFTMESNIHPGSEFSPTSVYGRDQKEMTLAIWKDSVQRQWKLKYNSRVVGHWSEDLFTHLRTNGTRVEWGGEVYNSNNGGRFTSTEMGSGHFAGEGYGRASYFRRLQVITSGIGRNWITVPRERLQEHVTSRRYYNIRFASNIGRPVGHEGFFYGGPGNVNNTE